MHLQIFVSTNSRYYYYDYDPQQTIILIDSLKSFNIKIQTKGFMTLFEHNNKVLKVRPTKPNKQSTP